MIKRIQPLSVQFSIDPFTLILVLVLFFTHSTIVWTQQVKRTFEVVTPKVNYYRDDIPAPLVKVSIISKVHFRKDGNMLFADDGASSIRYFRQLLNNGSVSVFMGLGMSIADTVVPAQNLSIGTFSASGTHPITGDLFFIDRSTKLRVLHENNTITTLSSALTSGTTNFGFDETGEIVYLVEKSNQKLKKLQLSTGAISTIIGVSVNPASKGYYEGLPGVNSRSSIISILSRGDEIYFSNSSAISMLDSNGLFWTIAGKYPSCTFNASYTGNATLACFKNPYLIDFIDGELYFVDNSNTIRKLVNGTIQVFMEPQPFTIEYVVRRNGDWYFSCDTSIRKMDQSGVISTIVGRVDDGIVPNYSAFQYGNQDCYIIGTLRSGNFLAWRKQDIYQISRKTGLFTKIITRTSTDSQIALDFKTDDFYFKETEGSNVVIKRYVYSENRVELMSGSPLNCSLFEFPESKSNETCLTSISNLQFQNGSLYFYEATLYRILKIDLATKMMSSVVGKGCIYPNCISGLGDKLIATNGQLNNIKQGPDGYYYSFVRTVLVRFSSLSPDAILEKVAGVEQDESFTNVTGPSNSSSVGLSSGIAFHPITGVLYFILQSSNRCALFKLVDGMNIFISEIPISGDLFFSPTTSKLYLGFGSIYEYDLNNRSISRVVTSSLNGVSNMCLTNDEQYMISIVSGFCQITSMLNGQVQSCGKPSSEYITALHCHSNGNVYISSYYDYGIKFYKFDIATKIFTPMWNSVPYKLLGTLEGSLTVLSEEKVIYSCGKIYIATPNNYTVIGGDYVGATWDRTSIDPYSFSVSRKGEIYFDSAIGYGNMYKASLDGRVHKVIGNGTETSPTGFQTPTYFTVGSKQDDFFLYVNYLNVQDGLVYPYGTPITYDDTSGKYYLAAQISFSGNFYTSMDDDIYSQSDRLLFDCGPRDRFGHCPRLIDCYGVDYMNETACDGHGDCIDTDTCECNDGYFSNDCSLTTCFNVLSNDTSNVCNGHGLCISSNNCSCFENYTGLNCSIVVVNSTEQDPFPNVHNSSVSCFGVYSNETHLVCSGYGQCVSTDNCTCVDGHQGSKCEFISCYGIVNTSLTVCSGMGICIGHNQCHCSNGYGGNQCQYPLCFGNLSTNSGVCNGHGSCIGPNVCSCKENDQDGYWSGISCDSCLPNYDSILTGCKTLNCPLNYFGANCSRFCEKEVNCSNHGVCGTSGYCMCYSNRINGFWNSSVNCSECEYGFYGSECLTQIIGPVKFLDSLSGISFKLFGPYQSSPFVNCSNLIGNSKVFGTSPTCQWTNMTSGEFHILFDTGDYTLLPNDYIQLDRNVFDKSRIVSNMETIQVMSASNTVAPKLVVSYSNQVGLCENIDLDASESFSIDGRDLIFHWNAISSPNNILSSIQLQVNQSSIRIPSTVASSTGVYKFSLQVESSFSGLKSNFTEISIVKSSIPLPILSIIGLTEISVTNLKSPVIVKKVVTFPDCFYSNQSVTINWFQTEGNPINFSVDSFGNLFIPSFSRIEEASYGFKVIVTSSIEPLSFSFASVKISTNPEPLSLVVYKKQVTVDGISLVAELSDREYSSENETWTWSCTDLSTNGNCSSVLISNFIQYSNSKSSSIYISISDFQTSSKLKVTLHVRKGSRTIESSTNIVKPDSATQIPPVISLISVNPSKQIYTKQDIINIQLSIYPNSGIVRKWALNTISLDSSSIVLNRMSISPDQSNNIVLDCSYLEEGKKYSISLNVTNSQNGLSDTYYYSFSMATSPKLCPCSIQPSSGIALETDFTFQCSNCQNIQNSLEITYGFIDDKSGANIPLYHLGELYSSKLPCSYSPLSNKIITTYIRIVDTFTGAYTETRRNVNIELPSESSWAGVKERAKSWSTFEKSLKDGDTNKMIFNSATISRTFEGMIAKLSSTTLKRNVKSSTIDCVNGYINPKTQTCICNSGFTKNDCSMNETLLVEVKEYRIDQLNKFIETFNSRNENEKLTEYYFTLQTYGLDSLIEKYDELDDSLMDKSYHVIRKLFDLIKQNPNLKVPRGVELLSTGILNSIYRYLRFKNFEARQDQLKELVSMIKDLGTFMLRSLNIGESDLKLNTDFAYLTSNKLFREDFSSAVFAANSSNRIILPHDSPLYINEPTNRKPISFITLSNMDFFNVNETLRQVETVESSTSKNTSQSFIRSTRMVHLYMNDYHLENISNPMITYHFELENPIPSTFEYQQTKALLLKSSSDTRTYQISRYYCIDFSNYTAKSSNCSINITASSKEATCTCSQDGIFMIAEELTTWIVNSPSGALSSGEGVLGMKQDVLVIVLPILSALCICCFIATLIAIVVLLVLRRKRKGKETNTDTHVTTYVV